METKERKILYRDLVPEDYDRWVELFADYDPEPPTADQMRKRRDEWDWNFPRLELTATTEDGRSVGFMRINHREHHAEGAYYFAIDVDKAFRGQGIGRSLLESAEAFAIPRGGTIFTTFLREGDEYSKRFLERNGYPLERQMFESELNLTEFDMTRFEQARIENRDDVSIMTWADVDDSAENRTLLHRVSTVSDTAPDMDIYGTPSQEQFEKDLFGSEWFIPEGLFIAVCDGNWVGMHILGPLRDNPDKWTTDYTGVIGDYRGRGFGLTMKLKGIDLARANGAKSIITHNDSENNWMLRINQLLGFVQQPGWLQMRKRI